MKTFIEDDFLLSNKTAIELYHNYAEKLPIIDFHNHLSSKQIADNRMFNTITKAWLEGDHYKWRAMRAAGIKEHYITGLASDSEKFRAWASVVPLTIRNPLYHWTHLELKRYFGINKLLNEKFASEIYETCNEFLTSGNHNVQDLLIKMNVELLCTTNDPIESLDQHKIMQGHKKLKMLPTFRPDRVLNAYNPLQFNKYINKLEQVANTEIKDYNSLIEALAKRHDFFHSMGCCVSDHALDDIPYGLYNEPEINAIFLKVRLGKPLAEDEIKKYQSSTLVKLLEMNHSKGWVQQLHIGAIRNNNNKSFAILGPDTGFDSIGETQIAKPLALLFNKLDKEDKLTQTICYNLNPRDNDLLITMLGNFNDGKIAGKMQYGTAWWFLDQYKGIEKHINDLSSYGLLHLFIGMVTDSRSFLSFPRHEYFRRILCNILGKDIEKGLIPNDIQLVGKLIEAVCYNNAKEYFNWQK